MKRAFFSTMVATGLAAVLAVTAFADKPASKVKVGDTAPTFTLKDQKGADVTLPTDKVVVLEWFNNECPFVKKHYVNGDMNKLAAKYADKGVVWLAINSTSGKSIADNAKIAEEWNMDRPILDDSTGEVGKMYGATNTPHMYVIKDGKLAYVGAIDSDSSSDASAISGATNYVAQALDEVLAGNSVTKSETKAYGCTVKYAKK